MSTDTLSINQRTELNINVEEITKFVRSLTGEEDPYIKLRSYHEHKQTAHKFGGRLSDPKFIKKIHQENIKKRLAVAISVNESRGTDQEQSKVDITGLRALFVDDDKNKIAFDGAKPNIISHGRAGVHAYWLLKPGEDVERFEDATKQLIDAVDSDPTVSHRAVILRIPGTYNWKTEPWKENRKPGYEKGDGSPLDSRPYMVTCEIIHSKKYTIDDVLKSYGCNVVEIAKQVEASPNYEAFYGEDNLEQAVRYINKVPGAIEGQKGDRKTYVLACLLIRDFALSFHEAMSIFESWNNTCSPPWSTKELEAKLRHAEQYGDGRIGGKLRKNFQSSGFSSKQIISKIEAHRKEGKATDEKFLPELSRTIPAECLPPGVKEAECPDGFLVTTDGIHKLVKDREGLLQPRLVCPQALAVTEKKTKAISTLEEQHGRKMNACREKGVKYEIAFKEDGEWQYSTSDASTTADSRAASKHLSNQGVFIDSCNAPDIVRYLTSYKAANSRRIPKKTYSPQMGWTKNGFLNGYEWIGDQKNQVEFIHHDGPIQEFAASIGRKGSFDEWKNAVSELHQFPVSYMGIIGSLAATLLEKINKPGFLIHWGARTSKGKSISLNTAASVYGSHSHDGLRTSWNTHEVGLEIRLAAAKNLPVFLDDTKNAPNKRILGRASYLIENGQSRTRGTTDANMRTVYKWRTSGFSTGEELLSSESQHAGAMTRTIDIWKQPIPGDQLGLVRRIEKATAKNYGHAGYHWIKWLIDNPGIHEEITLKSEAYASDFTKMYGKYIQASQANRMAMTLGVLKACEEYSDRALDIGLPLNCIDRLTETIIENLEGDFSDNDRLDDVIEFARETYATQKGNFWIPSGPKADWSNTSPAQNVYRGWANPKTGRVGFPAKSFEEELTKRGHQGAKTVMKSVAEEKNALVTDRNSSTKVVKIDGVSTRCYVFRSGLIDEAEHKNDIPADDLPFCDNGEVTF